LGSRPEAKLEHGAFEWELKAGGKVSILVGLGEDQQKASAVVQELYASPDLFSQATHKYWNEYLASVPLVAPAEPIHGGYETVLIVEDDALVRTYVVAQVRALGYRTLAATNAAEALTLIDGDTPIDLLFTDIVMPGTMNGRQLADEARRRRPGIKVLFTSGYAENAIVHHGRLDPGVLLLAKPYRKQQLAQMIRAALGAVDDDSSGDAVAGATRQQAV